MHHPRILEVVKQSRWLVFAVRVTFNEHNLSTIGAFVEHNRKILGAVQHSILGSALDRNHIFCLTINTAGFKEDTVPHGRHQSRDGERKVEDVAGIQTLRLHELTGV